MFDPDAFSTDFDLPESEPPPEGAPTVEEGPWISHGTVHLALPPHH